MKRNPIINLMVLFSVVSIINQVHSQAIENEKNKISYTDNCLNWESLKKKYKDTSSDNKVSILFLGDSHIQGGYTTNRIRNLFNEKNSHTGRGFVFPYNFAKNYGPEDVIFTSNTEWVSEKWSTPKANISSPVGYVISTKDTLFNIAISFKSDETKYPFNKITLIHSPCITSIYSPFIKSVNPNKEITGHIETTEINFNQLIDSCRLDFRLPANMGSLRIYAFYIENNNETLVINSLGITGISYKAYCEKIDIKPWLTFANTDCIILSLGTNDVYLGKADTSGIRKAILKLITEIRQTRPNCAIILTTPNDHLLQKKYNNPRIFQLCNIIKNVAISEKCGVWDFFTLMKDMGGAKEWHRKGLLFKDFVHLSKAGYKLQGELFFEAFEGAINQ
jgi:lysophospholipase L1-like esterase